MCGTKGRNVQFLPTAPSALKAPATFLAASAACWARVFSSARYREAVANVRREATDRIILEVVVRGSFLHEN